MYLYPRDSAGIIQNPSPSPSADSHSTTPASAPHQELHWPLYFEIGSAIFFLFSVTIFMICFTRHRVKRNTSVKSKAENAEPEPLPLYQYRASEPPPYGAAAGDGVAPPAYVRNEAPEVRPTEEVPRTLVAWISKITARWHP